MRGCFAIVFTAMFLSVCLFSQSFAASGKQKGDEEVIVRFSAYYPEHYPVFKSGWKPWEEMVEKESNGKFKFQNYLNGVLNSAPHGFRATKSDVCDISTGYPAYQGKSFDLGLVTDMPFLFPNTYVGALIMEELYPKYFKKEYEKMGVYLANWVTSSGFNVITKKPVRKLEDLKGLKLRSNGGTCSEVLEALGAVPVMLPNAETYTALQSGVIDGAMTCSGPAQAMKLGENAKYLTKLGIQHMGIPYAMNKKLFDRLSPEDKKFFYNKLRQISQIAAQAYDPEDVEAEKQMREAGVEIINLPPEEIERFKAAVRPVVERFVEQKEAKGLPARQMMLDIEKLKEKYKDLTPEAALELVTKQPVQGIIDF